ncbi:MAG TPA: WYL domain-containing protein [Sulfurovum sp.]|nr:WYL domain-containing protein [Sulfurovum sp.]
MAEVAINSNCIVQLDYLGNSKPLEKKYIKPHKIIATGFTYYLYVSYDSRNQENIGAFRSLAFNGMHSLSPLEYLKNETFLMEGSGNAFGLISKEKSITLKLEAASANYFKREGQFNKENFDFISEEIDGSVIMKMYYNNIQEVVKLIQSWMPLISVHDNETITDEVYRTILENAKRLTKEII